MYLPVFLDDLVLHRLPECQRGTPCQPAVWADQDTILFPLISPLVHCMVLVGIKAIYSSNMARVSGNIIIAEVRFTPIWEHFIHMIHENRLQTHASGDIV